MHVVPIDSLNGALLQNLRLPLLYAMGLSNPSDCSGCRLCTNDKRLTASYSLKVPQRNTASYLKKCLELLGSAPAENFELVVSIT